MATLVRALCEFCLHIHVPSVDVAPFSSHGPPAALPRQETQTGNPFRSSSAPQAQLGLTRFGHVRAMPRFVTERRNTPSHHPFHEKYCFSSVVPSRLRHKRAAKRCVSTQEQPAAQRKVKCHRIRHITSSRAKDSRAAHSRIICGFQTLVYRRGHHIAWRWPGRGECAGDPVS